MNKFEPIKMPAFSAKTGSDKGMPVTMSTTIFGEAGKEFEKMVEENNLNRSSLLRQMVYHCLGREEELEEIKRLVLLHG